MMIRRICALAACFLLLVATPCLAADFRFVDASGYTGYYVDASSVSYENVAVCTAEVAVVKADRNRMFRYTMRFDRGYARYQILGSEVVRYDTKEVLSKSGAETAKHPYGVSSPMREIVDYIYNELPHGTLAPDTRTPEQAATE